jgi:hypothetical protein
MPWELNGQIPRVQGNRVKAQTRDPVASLFKEVPPEFLRMIVVHELAHLKEREHDRAFLPALQPHGAGLPPARIRFAPLSDAARSGRLARPCAKPSKIRPAATHSPR